MDVVTNTAGQRHALIGCCDQHHRPVVPQGGRIKQQQTHKTERVLPHLWPILDREIYHFDGGLSLKLDRDMRRVTFVDPFDRNAILTEGFCQKTDKPSS